MVKKLWRPIVQYWQCSVAIVSALVGLGFQLWGPEVVTHWVLGVMSLLLVVPLLVRIWHDVRSGQYGADLLRPAAIIAAVLLGQYWVAIAVAILVGWIAIMKDLVASRSRTELKALEKQAPASAAHVFRGRKVVDVSVHQVQPNDRLQIEAGETVPVDAVIVEGSADFDELFLATDTRREHKDIGDEITSGTVNRGGTLVVKALRSARDSRYERMVRLARNAGVEQSSLIRQAGYFSIVFALAALAIAIAMWVVSGHAVRFLQVIVVATPVSLLIAAPLAAAAGLARATKLGIFIKNGGVLQRLAEIDTMAFYKTGILTRGLPGVAGVKSFKPFDKDEIVALAAGLGKQSGQVQAQAIARYAAQKHLPVSKAKHVQDIDGFGLEAVVRGRNILVGPGSLLERRGIAVPKATAVSGPQEAALYVAVDGTAAGVISLRDELRPDAKSTIARLKALHVRKTMLFTSDGETAARALSKRLGITDYRSVAAPAEALHTIVEDIPKVNRPVAFVGTGIGDVSLLTAADIGIMFETPGTDASLRGSADVLLMPNDFRSAARVVAIARRTFNIVRGSIMLGIGLSLLLVLAFATGHFPALLGVLCAGILDTLTLLYALRAHIAPKQDA